MVNRLKNRSDKGGRKTGFVYTPRDEKVVKARAEQTGGRFDSIFQNGIDTWRPKVGDNLIRILPPTWEGADYFGYDVWVHAYVGPDSSTYLCLKKMKNEPCPICAAAKESKDAGEEEEAKALAVKKNTIVWIIDRDEDKPTPNLWTMSWTMDRDVAALCHNKRSGKILVIDHPEKGYDLTIKRQGQGLKTRYFGLSIDREATPIDDDEDTQQEILDYVSDNPIPSVLKFYDADYLERMLDGTAEKKDDEMEDDEADEKPRRGRARDEEDDEVEERPSRGKGRRDVDEEDEEDEKPRRSKGRKEDEEDEEPKRGRVRVKAAEEDEEDEEDVPKRRRRARDEDAEEDEDEKPTRRARAGNGSDEDEDEESEEDERPTRSRRRRDDDDEEVETRRAGRR